MWVAKSLVPTAVHVLTNHMLADKANLSKTKTFYKITSLIIWYVVNIRNYKERLNRYHPLQQIVTGTEQLLLNPKHLESVDTRNKMATRTWSLLLTFNVY